MRDRADLPAQFATHWRVRSPLWRSLVVGWGLLAIVDFVDRLITFQSLSVALLLTGLTYPLTVLLSAALGEVYRRSFGDTRLTIAKTALVLMLCALSGLLVVSFVMLLRTTQGWTMLGASPLEAFIIPCGHYMLAFLAWSMLYFWIFAELDKQREHQRVAEAQMEALRAEIRELQLQLDPHFLFNALNGLIEEVPDHPEMAVAMIRDLTRYLRHVLAGIGSPIIPVASEAEGLGAYMRIQQIRFGDNLNFQLVVDPAAANRPIVNLLLQPLVENAFEHGDRSGRLDIAVQLAMDGEDLKIEIGNTGRLVPRPTARRDHGLGLRNLQRRLDVHYPGRHSFSLRQVEGDAVDPQAMRVVATLLLKGDPCSAS